MCVQVTEEKGYIQVWDESNPQWEDVKDLLFLLNSNGYRVTGVATSTDKNGRFKVIIEKV